MRDGINLSTTILFPQEERNKYPVVFVRTPYNKEMRIEEYRYILENGYVLVIQDVRGRFESEGKFEPYINEAKDGYDAIEWIAGQTWCDGNIGMIGASYNGSVQYCAAIEQPPHLKTIIPSIGSADLFYDGEYVHGIFLSGRLMWCAIIEATASDEEIINKDWGQLLNHMPVSELDSITIGKRLDYYQNWIQHNSKDEYWKQAAHREQLNKIKIPVFTQTGWFDTHLRSSPLVYKELTKAGNKNVKMVIGPWGHTDRESNSYNGEFMGDAADDINLEAEYIKWFDYWLKGTDNGIMNEPLVQLYAVNSNKWYNGNSYPFTFTTERKLFLSSNTTANLDTEAGELAFSLKDVSNGIDSFKYDPENVPVYSQEMLERGGYDLIREMILKRNDYLFYKTSAFPQEETLIGPISASIHASTSAVDTDWYAILIVLDKDDKFVDMISVGMLRAKFRNTLEKSELLEKDKVVRYNLEMDPYGVKLDKGQKIGLIITSSFGYPFLTKNLNKGKNNQTTTDYEIAKQKIYHTSKYESYISLPILNNEVED